MCIYYKDRKDLHYDSAEHIFPAAIGGKKKLPLDYVSREFNNDISKLEQEFIRESFVAMAREIEGPGKRGKLTEKAATKSRVHVIKNVADETILALGYIKKNKAYEIPHFQLNIKTGEIAISFNYEEGLDAVGMLNAFKDKCLNSSTLKMRTILKEELQPDLVLFGIQDGIEENYNCFYAKNPSNKLEFDAATIKRVGDKINMDGKSPDHIKYMPSSKRTVKFRLDYFRVYAKMAFNFIAHLKGKEFILNPGFDAVRNWIAFGGDNSFAHLNVENFNPMSQIGIDLPSSSHFILIAKIENKLTATVFLYGALSVLVEMHSNFTELFPTNGFICNWKESKEYLLSEYLASKIIC